MNQRRNLSRRQLLQGGMAMGAAAFAGAALTACGADGGSGGTTSGGGSSSSSSSSSSQSSASSASSGGSSSAGGGSLSFFGWDIADVTAGLGKGFDACRKAWQEKTGNKLTFDGVPFENFVSTGVTRARAGQLSDAIELLPDLNHEGIFPALKPITKADYGSLSDEVDGWSAAIIDPKDPNTFAGIPGGAQGTLWYYNKAIFKDAGLDPEAPPKTWAEFEAAAAAIKAKGKAPIGMSGVDGNLLWWGWLSFSPQFFTTANDVLQVRLGKVPLNDPRFLQSLEPLASTYAKGWWNEDYASKKFADVEAMFGAGSIGMTPGLITSAMNWRVWDDALGKDGYGVFPSPLVDGGKKQGQFFNPVLLYAINAKTDKADLAKDWNSFVVSKEGQEIMLRESGQFPNRKDVDLDAVANSPGASRIRQIVDEVGGVPVAQNEFNSAALSAATQNITQAAVTGNLKAFLDNLELLQHS